MSRMVNKRKRKRRIILVLLILSILILYGLFAYFSYHPTVQINKIVTKGNVITTDKVIEDIINKELKRKRFLFYSAGSFFTYDANGIEIALKNNPTIRDVSVHMNGVNSLKVDIVEFSIYALWCKDKSGDVCKAITKNGDTFYIDGITLKKSFGKYDIYYQTSSDESSADNSHIEDFEELYDLIKILHKRYTKSFAKIALDTKTGEIEVMMPELPLLKINIFVNNLKDVAEYLQITLHATDYNELLKEQGSIEYIDLRFGNRVYYK
jgi:cell division septal protein FtsQ